MPGETAAPTPCETAGKKKTNPKKVTVAAAAATAALPTTSYLPYVPLQTLTSSTQCNLSMRYRPGQGAAEGTSDPMMRVRCAVSTPDRVERFDLSAAPH